MALERAPRRRLPEPLAAPLGRQLYNPGSGGFVCALNAELPDRMMRQREAVFNFPDKNGYQYRRSSLRESNCVGAVADSTSGGLLHIGRQRQELQKWQRANHCLNSGSSKSGVPPACFSGGNRCPESSATTEKARQPRIFLTVQHWPVFYWASYQAPYLYRQADPCFLKWSHQFF